MTTFGASLKLSSMYGSRDPKWLLSLSRRLRWLAIPNIAISFIALQIIGFLLAASNPDSRLFLALIPDLVFQGEIWRVFSFLALPLSMSVFGMLFTLFFGYFILNSIESQWGSFKTTLYVLSSILFTIVFSLVFDYPVTSVAGFVSTWFLAAATLFPENQIHLYMVLPIKMKYLGWLAMAFILLQFLGGSWMDRFYLLTIYANYLIFFGPSLKYQWDEWQRRRRYRAQWK